MEAARNLAAALSELERTQVAMAGLSSLDGADWKRELIALRRQLQAKITEIGEAAERCDGLRERTGTGQIFWDHFAKMRATVALHQARWPAVAIDPTNNDYQQSIASVRAANRAFVAVAKEIIPTLSAGRSGG